MIMTLLVLCQALLLEEEFLLCVLDTNEGSDPSPGVNISVMELTLVVKISIFLSISFTLVDW